MFEELEKINTRPEPFEFYTASELWTDPHTSEQMLSYHLNEEVDLSSRKVTFIDDSVAWIVSRFDVGAGTRIADFGCGPGLYTTRLARKQADLTGIDFSKRSIRHAKDRAAEEGLSINYFNQNYLEFQPSAPFDLVIMIMLDYCVLSPSQRKTILKVFYQSLKSNGYILLDASSLNGFNDRKESATYEENMLNGFWSPNKYYCFLNTFKYEKEKLILDKYTIIDPARTREIYNWFQHFSPSELAEEFAECGFTVESFYADVTGKPFDPDAAEFAVVARKS